MYLWSISLWISLSFTKNGVSFNFLSFFPLIFLFLFLQEKSGGDSYLAIFSLKVTTIISRVAIQQTHSKYYAWGLFCSDLTPQTWQSNRHSMLLYLHSFSLVEDFIDVVVGMVNLHFCRLSCNTFLQWDQTPNCHLLDMLHGADHADIKWDLHFFPAGHCWRRLCSVAIGHGGCTKV